MVDQFFTTYQFKSRSNSVAGGQNANARARSVPERNREVFNVLDFGAKATGGGARDDDWGPIQDAMNAACAAYTGGVVYFPSGIYYVSKKIISSNATCGVHLVGDGGNAPSDAQSGSTIITDQRDYIIYAPHGTQTGDPSPTVEPANSIKGIRYLNFKNEYNGGWGSNVQTSTEPKSTTGYTDNCAGPSGKEGHGCVYLGSVFQAMVTNCHFFIGSGIGICVTGGFSLNFQNCTIIGCFDPDSTDPTHFDPNHSIGIWLRAGMFGCTKVANCATGIVSGDGPVDLFHMDVENVHNGIVLGSKPLTTWNPETHTVYPPENQARGQISTIRNNGVEKFTNYAYWFKTAGGNLSMYSNHCAGGGLGAVQAKVGIQIDGLSNSVFQSNVIEGVILNYGIDASGAMNCTFRACDVSSTGTGGVATTKIKPRDSWAAGTIPYGWGTGNFVEACNFDGAISLFSFPTLGPDGGSNPGMWGNCLFPVYDIANNRSNIGKPVTGFATTNAVSTTVGGFTVVHFASGASWPLSFLGTTTTSFPSGQRWFIQDATDDTHPARGTGAQVTNIDPTAGTVTLDMDIGTTVPSGHLMHFVASGTNRAKIRWISTGTGTGYWAIAG